MVVIQTENGLGCWLLLSSKQQKLQASHHFTLLKVLLFALYLVEGWRVSWRIGAVGAGMTGGTVACGAGAGVALPAW
jgi:hypothetical protein